MLVVRVESRTGNHDPKVLREAIDVIGKQNVIASREGGDGWVVLFVPQPKVDQSVVLLRARGLNAVAGDYQGDDELASQPDLQARLTTRSTRPQ
jgi:hypothetical protein